MTNRPNRQSGMAILMVLGITAAVTLLTAHMMAISETIAREAAVNAMTAKLRYTVESAADSAYWMHLTDRRLFSNRTLGNSLEDREATSDFEPWMLDGREHDMGDDCYAYLNDAIKSFSVDNIESVKDNFDTDDADGLELANTFIDHYKDYTDNDDFINLYGKEIDDYEATGFPTLPRNGAMQFRAELYWLENWQDLVTGSVTIIPPKGITFGDENSSGSSGRSGSRRTTSQNTASGKPNFFTASDEDIRNTLENKAVSITESQIEDVINARNIWMEDGTPLDELLDSDLLITVKAHFNFTESNYAEITAVAYAYDGAVKVTRTVTRECDMNSRTIHSDKDSETLSIWETRNY